MDRVAEKLSEWFGSGPFILFHVVLFAAWVFAHCAMHFDDGFQLLTVSVSLEAIFLSLFILRAENVAAKKNMRVTKRIDKKLDQ